MKIIFCVLISLNFSLWAQSVNLTTAGNLKVTHHLKCGSTLANKHTPADLYPMVKDCVIKDKVDQAIYAYLLANIYSAFDSKRVTDKSAHQAISVLRMNNFSKLKKESMQKVAKRQSALVKDPKQKKKLCSFLNKTGHPSYHPAYMIEHGMKAFDKKRDKAEDLKKIDSKAVWGDLLKSLCPA